MRIRTIAGVLAGALGVLGGVLGSAAPAAAAPGDIHPGVMMFTDGAQCTANFIFSDGGSTYIGYAAHCAGTGGATETNGCEAGSLPLGTPVEIDGATAPGTLAYSSWLTMQAQGETDADTCQYNDFALVRLAPGDVASVDPSVPHWGGPTSLGSGGLATGSTVHSYGNSSLRLGITQLSPKTGVSLGTTAGGWTHPVYTVTPGIPGDSGSGLLNASGQAVGVLSTLAVAPLPLSNNYSDLASAVAYMRSHGGPNASLVPGTAAFNGGQLPIGI
jgi:hypothetical protein